jgi:hypothetical protein
MKYSHILSIAVIGMFVTFMPTIGMEPVDYNNISAADKAKMRTTTLRRSTEPVAEAKNEEGKIKETKDTSKMGANEMEAFRREQEDNQ